MRTARKKPGKRKEEKATKNREYRKQWSRQEIQKAKLVTGVIEVYVHAYLPVATFGNNEPNPKLIIHQLSPGWGGKRGNQLPHLFVLPFLMYYIFTLHISVNCTFLYKHTVMHVSGLIHKLPWNVKKRKETGKISQINVFFPDFRKHLKSINIFWTCSMRPLKMWNACSIKICT